MADRSVVVRLRAEVGSYVAGLEKAKTATTKFGQEVATKGKGASADIERIGTAGVVAGGLVAAAFAKGIFTAANFEKEMSGVKAVSGASSDEMERLSDAALAAGASTKLAGVTASDAARAEAELVKAGVQVSDVLGGALMGSLTLAAAGQLDFADAATIAAQAMNIFHLNGGDVTHVADVLAAAANKSAGDVSQFGDALRQGGLVAEQTGLSLEESVGALAAFADNALIGSDAGTSLKTMLQRLTPQSTEAAELMERLGFSAYDTYGNFIGLEGLANELTTSLGGLTDQQRNSAMATLFGSDAVRGANILYEQGARGIHDYIQAVDDEGAAARMAAIQNDNLKGDVEALGGALESTFIENGSKATGALRTITQGATDMVNGFSEMPDAFQTVTLGLGGIVGAASLVGGGFVTLAPKIKASTDALKGMDSGLAKFAGNNAGKISAGLAGIGTALAVGVFAYSKATEGAREYKQEVDDLATALAPVAEGQSDLNTELENFLKAQQEGLSDGEIKALNAFGVTIDEVMSSIRAGGDALDPLRDKIQRLGVDMRGVDLGKIGDKGGKAVDAQRNLAAALGISEDSLHDLIDEMEDWDNQTQESAEKTIQSSVSMGTFTQSAVDAAAEMFKLKDGGTNWAAVLDYLSPKVEGAGDDAAGAAGEFAGLGGDMGDAEQAAKDLKEAIEHLLEPLDTRAAVDQFSSGINDMAKHFTEADAEVKDAQDNMKERQQALNDLLNQPVDQRSDNYERQVQSARDAIVDAQARIDEAIAGTSRTLEGNSQAAIDNRDMLDQLARDGTDAIEAAAADQNLSIGQVIYIRDSMIKQMEDEAERLGLNKEQVGFYVDALNNIPLGDIRTNVGVDGIDAAILKVQALLDRLTMLTATDQVYSVDFQQAEQQLFRAQRRGATGGLVPGGLTPIYRAGGGPTGTDTIPMWASPGEYVMQKKAVDRFGLGFMDALNTGLSPLMGLSAGQSIDHSRKTSIHAPITVSDRHTAAQVKHNLRLVSLVVDQ